MTTFLASHLKRKKRDGPASSLINSLKCSLLKERITEKEKRAGQVHGFCNEHSFNIARGLIDLLGHLLGPRRLFLTNFRPMNRLTLEPYVTKRTDCEFGGVRRILSFGGCAKIWISQTKGPEAGHRNQKTCRISITRGDPADLSASAVPAGRVWRPI